MSVASSVPSLTNRQLVVSALVGAILWLLAALILRVIGPMGALDGEARVLAFVVVVPGTMPFVYLLRAVAQLRGDQLLAGTAIATMAATLLDGVALSWVPWLYGAAPTQLAGAGATILWGVGVGLALAHAIGRSDGRPK